ncbi:MAG: helicase RepA family protein [Vicinamibacterales bacterium]
MSVDLSSDYPAPPDYQRRIPAGEYVAVIDSFRTDRTGRGWMLEVAFRLAEGAHQGRVLADQRFFSEELDGRRAKFVRTLLLALGAGEWDGGQQAAEAALQNAMSQSRQVRLAVDWEGYDTSRAPDGRIDWQARDKATIRGAKKFTLQDGEGLPYALGQGGNKVRPSAVVVKVLPVDGPAARTPVPGAAEAPEVQRPSRGPSRILSETELLSRPDAVYLIHGVLLEGSVASIVGKSGSGKTFLAADIAVHIAYEAAWEGHAVVANGHVVYVTAEGGVGNAKKRLAAMLQAHGHSPRNRIHTLPEPVNMREKGSVDALLADIRALEIPESERVVLIVLDTLARCFGGGDEQSAKDMGQFIDALGRATRELGTLVTVLVVHHFGKDGKKGSRGSSALPAALDTEIEVKRDGKTVIVNCTKQKDDEPFREVRFRLRQVAVGRDARGNPMTSCVLEALTATEVKSTRKDVEAAEDATLLAALQVLASFGSRGASVGRWFKAVISAGVEIGESTFNRRAKEWTEAAFVAQPRGERTNYELTDKAKAALFKHERPSVPQAEATAS